METMNLIVLIALSCIVIFVMVFLFAITFLVRADVLLEAALPFWKGFKLAILLMLQWIIYVLTYPFIRPRKLIYPGIKYKVW